MCEPWLAPGWVKTITAIIIIKQAIESIRKTYTTLNSSQVYRALGNTAASSLSHGRQPGIPAIRPKSGPLHLLFTRPDLLSIPIGFHLFRRSFHYPLSKIVPLSLPKPLTLPYFFFKVGSTPDRGLELTTLSQPEVPALFFILPATLLNLFLLNALIISPSTM